MNETDCGEELALAGSPGVALRISTENHPLRKSNLCPCEEADKSERHCWDTWFHNHTDLALDWS